MGDEYKNRIKSLLNRIKAGEHYEYAEEKHKYTEYDEGFNTNTFIEGVQWAEQYLSSTPIDIRRVEIERLELKYGKEKHMAKKVKKTKKTKKTSQKGW